jgi:tRNA(fMet)-specific endonuclease VapC
LLFGFRNGAHYDRNLGDLQDLLRRPGVSLLEVTWATADRFGRLAAALRRAGTPIPSNDIWVAAHAMESGAELVTLDRHFERIPGLALTLVEP